MCAPAARSRAAVALELSNISTMPDLPTQEDLFSYFFRFSNWNRWGADDVRGTLNHITSENVISARDLIRSGRTISLAWDVDFNTLPRDGNAAIGVPMRHMHGTGGDNGIGAGVARGRYLDKDGKETDDRAKATASLPGDPSSKALCGSGCSEWISFTFHGYTFTHLDSLAHMFWNGLTYNGYSAADTVNLRHGAALLDVVAAARNGGIISRGVLLDAAEFGIGSGGSGEIYPDTGLAQRWMEPGEFVTAADLEAIEKKQGVQVGPGDLIFLRTGYGLKKRWAVWKARFLIYLLILIAM